MLQENNGKVGKVEVSLHGGKRWHHFNILILGT
jgi:hypothetical protein